MANLAEDSAPTFRFTSTPTVHAPGLIAFFRKAGRAAPDKTQTAHALYLLAQAYPDAPAWTLLALAEGQYTLDGDTVVVASNASLVEAERAVGGET